MTIPYEDTLLKLVDHTLKLGVQIGDVEFTFKNADSPDPATNAPRARILALKPGTAEVDPSFAEARVPVDALQAWYDTSVAVWNEGDPETGETFLLTDAAAELRE
jgi:hypothetical protein